MFPQAISIRAISRSSPYLEDRHFAAALTAAALIHLVALLLWMFSPHTPVVEIPVRILNIKLGEQEEEVDIVNSIRETPDAKNSKVLEKEMARFFEQQPTPVPASPEALAHALSRAVKAMKPPGAATPPPPAPPQPAKQEVAKLEQPPAPMPPLPNIIQKPTRASEHAPHQYVRQQAYDYRPLGDSKQLPKNGGSKLGNTTSTQAEIMARYEQLISAWIDKFKVYPEEARSSGIQGKGIVRIRIDRKGNVRFVTLDESTGSDMLDRAVMEMIHDANPLPPVPDDYKSGDLFEFKIPISFKM